MEKTPQLNEFERKKTSYFSRFALRNFGDMKILRKGGVLGKENRDWRNVSEHSLAEAAGADILAEALGANRENVIQATILHDWYKRHEIKAMKEVGGGRGYAATVGEDKKLLREYEISPNIIKLTHSNTPESMEPEYLARRTLEEKIIHYMDSIMNESEFINFRDRMKLSAQKNTTLNFRSHFEISTAGKAFMRHR